MLTVVQLVIMTAVFVGVYIYNTVRPAIAYRDYGIGLIEGVVYTEDDSSALIDGRIIKEGEMIHGASIIKIYRDRVELEKDGKIWEQHVGERPNPAWEERDEDQLLSGISS